jgi:Predicted Zn-dependent protease (DUF2268)
MPVLSRRESIANRHLPVFAALILALGACSSFVPPAAPGREAQSFESTKAVFIVEDAERFTALLARNPAPTAEELQREYIDPGSDGIRIFTPHRIENAGNLAANLRAARADYDKAIDLCLPVVRDFAGDAERVMRKVSELLGEADVAPAYVVFGAGNSGGTANEDGLVLGLEVVCRQPADAEQARRQLEDFVAHEITHVYQSRYAATDPQVDLLFIALREGFADFVMDRASGRPSAVDAARTAFGLEREAGLWREFKRDLDAGRTEDTDWFYKFDPKRSGQPADMGYWIGKRICERYYAQAGDKAEAMRTLLLMRDPRKILETSGYGRDFLGNTEQVPSALDQWSQVRTKFGLAPANQSLA